MNDEGDDDDGGSDDDDDDTYIHTGMASLLTPLTPSDIIGALMSDTDRSLLYVYINNHE